MRLEQKARNAQDEYHALVDRSWNRHMAGDYPLDSHYRRARAYSRRYRATLRAITHRPAL